MDRNCAHCGKRFRRHPAVRNQSYCGLVACQRARKRKWQREKLAQDADYRANQAAAQKSWRERKRAYWRDYRERHPESVEENRRKQRLRNWQKRGKPGLIAKMDELGPKGPMISGRYRLVPLIAKMDALIAEIHVISGDSAGSG